MGSKGRLLRREGADGWGAAGTAVLNFALDSWNLQPSLPKAVEAVRVYLEYLLRKQDGYGYMVICNINICRNNLEDVRKITEFAHENRIATDYHINETPMIEQDDHFRHLSENPTYIRPEDWREVDSLIDWLIDRNKEGYQMVNSVRRLQEMKAFMRMSSGLDLRKYGWNGDGAGTNGETSKMLAGMPGIVQGEDGDMHFSEWSCRAGQNNVIIRTDGTVAPCFPMYPATYDWGNIDKSNFDSKQLAHMKETCQRHCFSTLNHNLAYCYDDARVIKFLWNLAVTHRFQGGHPHTFQHYH